jgi:threonine/homoserine/homoserine lactone efflux protein
MLIPILGLGAGLLHVWSGPDHLAAVAPLVTRSHQEGWRIGLRWGLGHSAGVALVGLAALGLREALPIEAISGWSDRLVGAMLIGIGVWGFRQAARLHIHTHHHTHDGETHAHLHVHSHAQGDHDPAGQGHPHAALGIGTLHGFAGSSHFLGVLPALALPTVSAAVTYLLAFAAGTVLGMMMFATLIAWGARRLGREGSHYRNFLRLCAASAVGVGMWWLVGPA